MKNRKKTQNNVGKYEYLTRKREMDSATAKEKRQEKKQKANQAIEER